jgi:hypothetical protein
LEIGYWIRILIEPLSLELLILGKEHEQRRKAPSTSFTMKRGYLRRVKYLLLVERKVCEDLPA